MAIPALQVRVAFASDPYDIDPTWTDITHDVQKVNIKRGRQTELNREEAGTAKIQLKNFQGNYWPNNAAGPYFGNILPGKRVSIRAKTLDIGKTTPGTALFAENFHNNIEASLVTPVETVPVSKIFAHVSAAAGAGNRKVKCAIYLESTLALLGETDELDLTPDTYEWREFTLTTPVTLTQGTVYLLAIWGDGGGAGNLRISYDDLPPGDNQARSVGAVYAGAWPDPLVAGLISSRFAIYAYGVYDLFTGFVEGWPPSWLSKKGGQGPLVTIKCADLIKNLSNYDLNTTGFDLETSGIRVGEVLNEAGWDCTHFIDDVTNTITSDDATILADLLVLLNEIKADHNLHIADTAYHKVADATNVITSPAAINLATAIALCTEAITDFNNHLLVGTTFHLESDSDNAWFSVPPINLATCIAAANLGKISINGHLLFQQCQLDRGQSNILASGAIADVKAQTHLFLVQDSEFGIMYIAGNGDVHFEDRHHRRAAPHTVSQAIFGDDLGENFYHGIELEYDDTYIFNDIRMTRLGGAQQAVDDEDSITAYGTRTHSKTGLIMETDLVALDLANYKLKRYKDPALRARKLYILGERNAVILWPILCGYEISTRITLRRNEASIDEDYFIEGIRHDIDLQRQTWATYWQLSNALAQVYWLVEIVGFSELGVTTWLGY